MTPADLNNLKLLAEYLAAYGVPGGMALVLLIWLRSNADKTRDPASEVLASLTDLRAEMKEVRRGVDDMDSRLIRVETRQEMLMGGTVQHFTDRTIPPR